MGENSAIEWTDNTFNPWIGCAKVHAGCEHCYAEYQFDFRRHTAEWGVNGTRVLTTSEYWRKPLRWNAEAQKSGQRIKVFCGSLCDVFEDWNGPLLNHRGDRAAIERVRGDDSLCYWDPKTTLPDVRLTRWATMHDVRKMLFDMIDVTPHLDWQLLTKRPENITRFWGIRACQECTGRGAGNCTSCGRNGPEEFRANVWLGTSISDQASADAQIPELLKCRKLSPVLFLSCEPLLGPIDLGEWMHSDLECDECDPEDSDSCLECRGTGVVEAQSLIDWVIVGGESGTNARPMRTDWVRAIRDQCADVEVPFFFKQWGEWVPWDLATPAQRGLYTVDESPTAGRVVRVGKKLAGNTLDGRQHLAFPEVRA